MNYKIRMITPVVGMLLLFGYVTLALNNLTANTRMKTFAGGKFEASGVVHMPGTDSVLFVDDGRPGEVFWMQVDESGNQAGAVKPVRLGVSVIDLEGITTDGSHYYVVGSQSKSKGSDREGLLRFNFDARHQQIENVQSISGLKRFLAENVAELHGMAERSYKDGGINVEGLAWDAQGNRWLLGLRSPVIDGQTLVVPVRLRESNGAFSAENLEVVGKKAIRLPLDGAGVRSIEYDDRAQAFRILTGAAMNSENTNFKLWEWNGKENQPTLRAVDTFDSKLKPEGVTRASSGGRSFTFVVFDTSGYSALD
jgi:hypothetical protein